MSQIQIPKGWLKKDLDEILAILENGDRPKGGGSKMSNGIPSLGGEHLNNEGGFNFKNIKYIPEDFFKNLNKGVIKKNDILMVKDGYTGRTSFVDKKFPYNRASVSEHIFILRPNNEIIPKYLYYFLKSNYAQSIIKNKTRGIIAGINKQFVKTFPIVFPKDKKIQDRIVQKLDNILEQLEEKKKLILDLLTTEKIQELTSKNSQQLLKSALEGKLTQEWRLINKSKLIPASVLLKQMLDNRRKIWETKQLEQFKVKKKIPKNNKWRQKYKDPLIPESNLPKLPDLWEWVTLDQITWSIRDGPHYSPEYASEGIPFITGGNVRPWGVDFSKAKKISPQLHQKLSERCKPEKNDILYTKGGTTGIARVNTYEKEFNVWVHVAVLKLLNPIVPFYVQHALNSPFCYFQSQNYTHGVGNKDLGLTRMIRILLPLPPLKEQIEICKILNIKFSEIHSINKKIDEVTAKKEASFSYINRVANSVLKEAFSGKLVN